MKNIVFLIFPSVFVSGVFGSETDKMKTLSVMEGDPVTLNICVDTIQKDGKILWTFGENAIAKMNKETNEKKFYDGDDGIFRDRLQLNYDTGSLIIRNIRTNHSGIYKATIRSESGTSYRNFNVTVIGVFDAETDKMKSVSVMEGQPVTLTTDVAIKNDVLILWSFGRATKKCVYNAIHHIPCHIDAAAIAKMDGETKEISLDDDDGEIFTNHLQLNQQTGDLTIRKTRTGHSGVYILQITNNTATKYKRFNVTVSVITESDHYVHPHWKTSTIVLAVLAIMASVAVGIIYRKRNAHTVKSFFCCQSNSGLDHDVGLEDQQQCRDSLTRK